LLVEQTHEVEDRKHRTLMIERKNQLNELNDLRNSIATLSQTLKMKQMEEDELLQRLHELQSKYVSRKKGKILLSKL
jgi:hypothetical protein